jgi:hypothetical protein
MLNHVLLL